MKNGRFIPAHLNIILAPFVEKRIESIRVKAVVKDALNSRSSFVD